MIVRIKKLTRTATMPTRATDGSSGWDLYADLPGADDVFVGRERVTIIPTGIAIELPAPDGSRYIHEAQVRMRSGLATKHGIMLVNGIGTIDNDYRGEVKVGLWSPFGPHRIKHGERVAQLVVAQVAMVSLVAVEDLSDTVRGTGGFGSTGR